MLPYSDSTNAYLYSITNDFNVPRSQIRLECLDLEVTAAGLGSIYVFALSDETEDDVLFMFTRRLTGPEVLTLDGVVSSHTGVCTIEEETAETYVQSADQNQVLMYDSTTGMFVNRFIDHGTLTHKQDDDHTQYLRTDGGRELTGDWDAGNHEITADGGFKKGNAQVDLAAFTNTTGILTGGAISVNAGDNTKLDIEAGTGIHVDMSDPSDPQVHYVSWNDMTIDPGLVGYRVKWAAIDYNPQTGDTTAIVRVSFTEEEKRSVIILGRFWGETASSTVITVTVNYPKPAYMLGNAIEDLSDALGPVNYYGNEFYPSDVSLKLSRTAGKAYRFAANYNINKLSPNVYESSDQDPINSYSYQLPSSETTAFYSTIQPDYYDSSSVLTVVPTGKWSVQKIYYYPVSNIVNIFYGTQYYDSSSLAYDGIVKDDVQLNNSLITGSMLRAYLIVKQGCTNLEDTDQAQVVRSYGTAGLVPGYTNHGELGGLSDDDHPQYHNDTRGDALYYRKAYIEQSENIKYTLPWGVAESNVSDKLDYAYNWIADSGYSGRITPDVVIKRDPDSTANLIIEAGSGYIVDGDIIKTVTWDSTTFVNFAFEEQGVLAFYVNENGVVFYDQIFSYANDRIRLGFVLVSGVGATILSIVRCPCKVSNAGNSVAEALQQLGPFVHDEDSGIVQVSNNNPLALTLTQASVHWGLSNYTLSEIDTVDDIANDVVYSIYKAKDGLYYPDYWFLNPFGGAGIFQGNRWNDTTQNGYDIESGNFTFTFGSNKVTVTDSTAVLDSTSFDDYYISLESDGLEYIVPIAIGGVDTTGSVTTITLVGNYLGTGGTGNAIVVKALPRLPSGKFSKYIIVRLLDEYGSAYIVPGSEIFDSENDARFGNLPSYPDYVKQFDVKVAYLLGSLGLTTWEGHIYDLRPIPMYREGGGGIGGGAEITSHSALSDLDADDHLQYLRTDGTRELSGIQRYDFDPIFASDRALITKKYVDDMFPVDHNDLLNKGTNTHAQIDTHIADTTIHFTEASIDHNAITNTHNLTTDIDHNLLTNTHNLTTDIDHDTLTNTHNLTTDIDHNQLTNYDPDRHFLFSDVTAYVSVHALTADPDSIWSTLGHDYASSDALSSTSNVTYQDKVSITIPASSGLWRVGYTMEYNANSNNKDVQVRLYNSTDALEVGQNSQQTNNNANWFSFSGFHHVTTTGSSKTFVLQYRAGTASCSVRNAELEIWRIT